MMKVTREQLKGIVWDIKFTKFTRNINRMSLLKPSVIKQHKHKPITVADKYVEKFVTKEQD